ncbi:hypothetical protein MFLAVUS_003597 [Mucor flavus]|uniref:Uncharacterized protein n=1 Tax=Mucor flavus TaxID=439312 RepID=A0ABP9YTK1_9FUNG
MGNSQLFVSSETSVVIYIFLVLIQTVTTTVIVFVPFDRYGPHPAVSFFLIDMTMLFAIIMAAHYGPAWIQDELEEPKENTHPIYGDLGPNRGFD